MRGVVLPVVAAVALLMEGAAARERPEPNEVPHGPGWADPGDVISAEIGFARLARDKGQWTAFRATAAKGAQQLAPGPVRVADFLKGRKDPSVAAQWQPHAVWMACDGSFAVSQGAWQLGSLNGWFMTVWQRQDKGGYKWVLDQRGRVTSPLKTPEFVTAKVADCPARKPDGSTRDSKAGGKAAISDWLSGHSGDGTLAWTTRLSPDGDRRFIVSLRVEGQMVDVAHAEARAGD